MRSFFKHLHRFFVPSEHNNYRAKGLHLDVLTSLLGFAVILSFTTGSVKEYVLGIATDITIQRLHEKTNEIRMQNGLPPLQYNNTLASAASAKGQHMFTHNYWSHYGPDGATPWMFISGAGYSYEFAGENLAQGFMFSDGVVDAWMASETHKANILRGEYDEVGYAVMNGNLQGEETTLVVQMFGKPSGSTQRLASTVNAEELPQDTGNDSDPQNNIDNPDVSQEAGENTEPSSDKRGSTSDKEQEPKTTPITINKNLADSQMVQSSSDKANPTLTFMGLNQFSFDTTLAVLGILIMVLFVDLYFAHKMNILRLTGKNAAHIIFLFTIIIGIIILKNGIIM